MFIVLSNSAGNHITYHPRLFVLIIMKQNHIIKSATNFFVKFLSLWCVIVKSCSILLFLLQKKRNSERDIWRSSWGSGHSHSSCSIHSTATNVGKDDFWAALQTNYNYIMDTHLLDSCKEARGECNSGVVNNGGNLLTNTNVAKAQTPETSTSGVYNCCSKVCVLLCFFLYTHLLSKRLRLYCNKTAIKATLIYFKIVYKVDFHVMLL